MNEKCKKERKKDTHTYIHFFRPQMKNKNYTFFVLYLQKSSLDTYNLQHLFFFLRQVTRFDGNVYYTPSNVSIFRGPQNSVPLERRTTYLQYIISSSTSRLASHHGRSISKNTSRLALCIKSLKPWATQWWSDNSRGDAVMKTRA